MGKKTTETTMVVNEALVMTIPKKVKVNSFDVQCMSMDGSGESLTIKVETVYTKSDLVIKSVQPKLMKSGFVAVMATINEDATTMVEVIKEA